MSTTKIETSQPPGELPEWVELVRRHVGSLRYGSVEIIVHDSRVIQIEKIERVRLEKSNSEPTRPAKTKL